MTSPIQVSIDLTQFQEEFRRRVQRSSHNLPYVTNAVALGVAKKAYVNTYRASKDKIIGLGAHYRTHSKQGKLLKRPKLVLDSPMRAVFAGWLRKVKRINPKKLAKGQFDKMMAKAISGRLRGVGFIQMGWLPAVRKLAAAIKESFADFTSGAKQKGKPKGSATVATDGLKCFAVIENWAKVGEPKVKKYLIDSLRHAIEAERKEMEKFSAEWFRKNYKQN